jgi:uncharacterized integral membrane protein
VSILHRTRETPAAAPATPAGQPATSQPTRIPHTRTGAAWIGICTAALTFVVLIIFMLQNTRSGCRPPPTA